MGEDVYSLDVFESLPVEHTETVDKLFLVVLETSLDELLAFKVGEPVDHVSTDFSAPLDDRLQEINEVPLVGIIQFDDHAYVDEVHSDLLFVLSDHFHDV